VPSSEAATSRRKLFMSKKALTKKIRELRRRGIRGAEGTNRIHPQGRVRGRHLRESEGFPSALHMKEPAFEERRSMTCKEGGGSGELHDRNFGSLQRVGKKAAGESAYSHHGNLGRCLSF